MMIILLFILTLILAKVIWVIYETSRQGSLVKEQTEVVRRANYLISKVATSPKQLMDAMPRQIPSQFQGEWAIYSCSMTCKALANIAALYPQTNYKEQISKIINIAMANEIRGYDAERWDEVDGYCKKRMDGSGNRFASIIDEHWRHNKSNDKRIIFRLELLLSVLNRY